MLEPHLFGKWFVVLPLAAAVLGARGDTAGLRPLVLGELALPDGLG